MKKFYQFSVPSEFWPITPLEAKTFIEARTRQRIVMAWEFAGMARWAKAKTFPKSPQDLFPDKSPKKMSVDQVLHFGKQMYAEYEKSKNAR